MFLGMIQFVLSRHASDRAVGFLENFFEFSQNRVGCLVMIQAKLGTYKHNLIVAAKHSYQSMTPKLQSASARR